MNIAEFIEKYSPKFKAVQVDARPDGLSTWEGARHWLCSFTTTRGQFVTFFSQGKAIKAGPVLANVLGCIASDISTGDMTYREACREWGEKLDYQTWLACREMRDHIIDTFGRVGFDDLLSLDSD